MTTKAGPVQPAITHKSLEDFEYMLAHHDSKIVGLETSVGEVKNKLDTVINAVGSLNNALTIATSKNPFNLPATLSVIRDGSIILGLAVSAIIYVTTGHFSADWARQAEFNNLVRERLLAIDKRTGSPGVGQ